MSIPKIIHYCWFGKSEIPKKELNCILTWKRFFPDYQFKLWNEENTNINECEFAKEAYELQQYAFVSDYVRAKVLYEYGGMYLDTDIMFIESFPKDMLDRKGFLGFERKAFVGTAIIACESQNEIIHELLEFYRTHNFINKNGDKNIVANVSILTDILKDRGLKLGGERQKVAGFDIFNREIFYPKKIREDEYRITDETIAIHMFTNSWMTDREKKRGTNKVWIELVRPLLRACRAIGIKIVGKEKIYRLEVKIRNKLM